MIINFNIYSNNDFIFHYTKTETAINKILKYKKLKFSNLYDSKDPREFLNDTIKISKRRSSAQHVS